MLTSNFKDVFRMQKKIAIAIVLCIISVGMLVQDAACLSRDDYLADFKVSLSTEPAKYHVLKASSLNTSDPLVLDQIGTCTFAINLSLNLVDGSWKGIQIIQFRCIGYYYPMYATVNQNFKPLGYVIESLSSSFIPTVINATKSWNVISLVHPSVAFSHVYGTDAFLSDNLEEEVAWSIEIWCTFLDEFGYSIPDSLACLSSPPLFWQTVTFSYTKLNDTCPDDPNSPGLETLALPIGITAGLVVVGIAIMGAAKISKKKQPRI